ncbi:helix-turn-helix domain-containing protein [Thioclava sp. 15-R06ZXC-3]|uniref:Helix-turn-helix domain-containing protein n=1 Tax=Thioclava arctica TaxID=3238301 RepID=A0ABV3TQ70_9RHOB
MTRTIHSAGQTALIEALISARRAAGLSQSAMAERLRCHQSMIARIESGERRIDVVELVILARATGTSAAAILATVEPEVPLEQRI